MIAIVSLLCVLTLSLFVTRRATVALAWTGLPEEPARSRARSAFRGVGGTTGGSEKVLDHPVRRRILRNLLLVGNVGILTAASCLILTFLTLDADTARAGTSIGALIVGILVLMLVATNRWFDRQLAAGIGWALERHTDTAEPSQSP